MLLLVKVDEILKEKGYKQNAVRFNSYNDSKVIFVLLTEVIALYINFIIIDVWRPSLKKLVSSCFIWYLSLKNYFNNLLQFFSKIVGNISKSLKESNKKFI